jgi:hypothetical protein
LTLLEHAPSTAPDHVDVLLCWSSTWSRNVGAG